MKRQQILASLDRGVKTAKEIHAETGIPTRTIRWYIARLETEGEVFRSGGRYLKMDDGWSPLPYRKSPVVRQRILIGILLFMLIEALAYSLGRGLI